MGIEVADAPQEYGVDCPNCTPTPFSVGETPKYISVIFHNIYWCSGGDAGIPNGRPFVIKQADGFPCLWNVYTDDQILVSLAFGTVSCHLQLSLFDPIIDLFRSTLFPSCQFSFTNDLTCAGGHQTEGGFAELTSLKYSEAKTLIYDYGFHPIGKNLIEIGTCADGNKYIRNASKIDKTSCYTKYDPNTV